MTIKLALIEVAKYKKKPAKPGSFTGCVLSNQYQLCKKIVGNLYHGDLFNVETFGVSNVN